jgi:hypothetical protein
MSSTVNGAKDAAYASIFVLKMFWSLIKKTKYLQHDNQTASVANFANSDARTLP